MKTKMSKIVSVLLCLVMLLGMFQMTALAATAEQYPPFTFEVDKNVVQGGNVAPGQETFTFELVYGIVGENNQHIVEFTPVDGVTLEDCGINFSNDTITTNGVGEKTFTLGGTIDLSLVNCDHHWQFYQDNSGAEKFGISLKLTEKNEGKAGWTYSDAVRYLSITVKGNEISTSVSILGNDVFDNNFENIYTATSAPESIPVRDTVTIVIGNNEEPVEEDNPDTGAPVFVGAVVGALAAAK
ncbi:MAG: hypothetical protein ACI4IT_02090 [Oscillospiraceae bacterium]